MIDNKNETIPYYKLKDNYYFCFHGEDIRFKNIDISKNIQQRIGKMYIIASEERQKLPFEVKNEKKEMIESVDFSKFNRVKREYMNNLIMGDKIEKYEKDLSKEMKKIIDDVLFDINQFKIGLDYDCEIFKEMKSGEKKTIYKIRKRNYIQNKLSVHNINNMSPIDRLYYNFKLLQLFYKNFHNEEFFNTRMTFYIFSLVPTLSFLHLKYIMKSNLLTKIIVPINLILCSYLLLNTFKQDIFEISMRKTGLSFKVNNLNLI